MKVRREGVRPLQWSHDLSVMETTVIPATANSDIYLLQWRLGAGWETRNEIRALQWSHDLSVMETRRRRSRHPETGEASMEP